MAFGHRFRCTICGVRYEYGILCYIWVPPDQQPKSTDDDKCSQCDDWASKYLTKLRGLRAQEAVVGLL